MKWILVSISHLAPFLLYEKFIKQNPPSTELPIVIISEIIAISLVIYWMKKMGELSWNRKIENEIKYGQAPTL